MKKPLKYKLWLVGMLSIIPGLGFWIIGLRRKAVMVTAIYLLTWCFYISTIIFSLPGQIREISILSIAGVWVLQGFYTIINAYIQNNLINDRHEFHPSPLRSPTNSIDGYRRNKTINKSIARVSRFLHPDEEVQNVMLGLFDMHYHVHLKPIDLYTIQTWYIVLTLEHVLLISRGMSDNMKMIKRISREDVHGISLRKGLIADELIIDIDNISYLFKISFLYRTETLSFVNELSENFSKVVR